MAESKPTSLKPLSRDTYDQLRQRVQSLKGEQQQLLRHQNLERQLETSALLQQQQHYDTQLSAAKQEAASLQQRLRDALERAAKTRQHNERQHKALAMQMQQQQEQLQEQLQQQAASHKAEADELQQRLEQAEEQWGQRLAAAEAARDADRAELEAAKLSLVSDLQQKTHGEVDAIQRRAEQLLQAAREESDARLARIGDIQQQLQECQLQLADEQQQRLQAEQAVAVQEERIQQLSQSMVRKERRAEAAAAQRAQQEEQWQQHREMAAQRHGMQVRELKAQHALELDAVQTKLQAVLGKKDACIAQLKARLAAVEHVLQQQQRELAAAAGLEDAAGAE